MTASVQFAFLSPFSTTTTATSAFNAQPPSLFRTQLSSLGTHSLSSSSLSSTTDRHHFQRSTTTTGRRRWLCKPPHGKYIREDYLVKKISAKEVQELVKGERTVPIVLNFYATWCGPCILMAQVLEMLAVEYESNVMIVKVDTDDEYEFARDMLVRGLPTVYFISPDPSKHAIRTEGLIPIEMMRDIIDKDM